VGNWSIRRKRGLARASLVGFTVVCMGGLGGSPRAEREAARHATWSDYLGGADSSHYSALDEINRTNVGRLEVAWEYATRDGIPYAFNPIVVDGVLYAMAKHSSIVALDATSGKELWSFSTGQRADIFGGVDFLGKRGINYWESRDRSDRRLLIALNDDLVAIDARTGKAITSFGQNGRVDLREGLGRDPKTVTRIQSATPGRIFENLIITGSATGEEYGSPPGDIRAYDVVSGKLTWTFHTVPHPGEYGYDTWPKDAWKYAGGTNAWGEITLDEKRGIAYVPLGSPTYDFYGADRTGDNLFSDCLVALDARTGKRLWHRQLVHHDLWDYDLTAAPQLLTVRHNGKAVDVVAQATKQGFLYVFDRVTGEPLWPIEERPVPKSDVPGETASPTQPFNVAPPPFARQSFTVGDINRSVLTPEEQAKWRDLLLSARNEGIYTPPSLKNTVEMPGNRGGANWGNTAVDPSTGTLYVVSMDVPAILKLVSAPVIKPDEEEGATSAERGRAIYEQRCALCHGATLQGRPPAVPPLVEIAHRVSAEGIKNIVSHGMGDMPAFGELRPSGLDSLVAFLSDPGAGGRRPGSTAESSTVKEAGPPVSETKDGAGAVVRYWTGYGLSPAAIGAPWSTITAYDLNEGTIKWKAPLGDAPQAAASYRGQNRGIFMERNGAVVTAGGLLFIATKDEGVLRAYDKDSGQLLWSTPLPAASEGVPAAYEAGGREYLVVCAASSKGGAPVTEAQAASGDTLAKAPVHRAYVAFALPVKR